MEYIYIEIEIKYNKNIYTKQFYFESIIPEFFSILEKYIGETKNIYEPNSEFEIYTFEMTETQFNLFRKFKDKIIKEILENFELYYDNEIQIIAKDKTHEWDKYKYAEYYAEYSNG